jgi:hypothetical protein
MSKKTVAKTIRVLTIPPMLVSVLLTVIFLTRDSVFRGVGDLIAAIMCLAVIPTLAYPLQPFIPGFRGRGRSGQRALAFVTSAVGYVVGFLYAFLSGANAEFKFIVTAYLVSVVMLLIFNKLFHFKASGHACGVLGPLLFAVYFMGWMWAIPCTVAAIAVVWSSINLSRHTLKELCLGGMCAMVAFAVVGINILP